MTTANDQAEFRIALWHRDDLRIRDNPALAAAARDGSVRPVYIVDPQFYTSGMACDARLRFLHECLMALDDRYRTKGSELVLKQGSPEEILSELPVDRIYVNKSVTGRYGKRRDEAIFDWDMVRVFTDDGIDWTDRSREAYDWQTQAEEYFNSELPPVSDGLPANSLETTTSIDTIETTYDVTPTKETVPTGGVSAAWDQLRAFAQEINAYPDSISPPAAAETQTSHVSPYLKFGCLTPRQVYQYVMRECSDTRGLEMYTTRLYWNRHYKQKLADWSGWMDTAVNPVFRGLFRDSHDPELVAAWKAGNTGFPLVDASMRALKQTGWLNFRMRAMCTSFYHYILQCWWKIGADHYYHELIDADAAINYTQWQTQANLTGVHPVRIYNPRKQVRENDADGTFIKRYVPELAALPAEHLPQPEKTPIAIQQDCGVEIGETYPYPIVDFEARRTETRELYRQLADRAREVIEHEPEIRARASLSNRHGTPTTQQDNESIIGDGQAALSDFDQ